MQVLLYHETFVYLFKPRWEPMFMTGYDKLLKQLISPASGNDDNILK